MPVMRERSGSVFDYLKDAVFVVDEPSSVENYLGEVYQTLAERYAQTDAVDDLAVTPEELYLSAEELRAKLDQRQRIELRVLGRAAAEIDQAVALDAEAPKVQLGRARGVRAPLFLFRSPEHRARFRKSNGRRRRRGSITAVWRTSRRNWLKPARAKPARSL